MAETKVKTITAVKTATFKLHNPSKRKRAMLEYALYQNHKAYTKALNHIQPLIEQLVADELSKREDEKDQPAKERNSAQSQRKWARQALLFKEINAVIQSLPLALSSKANRSIPGAIIGQIESHLELQDEQDSVGLPSVRILKPREDQFDDALAKIGKSLTLEEMREAQDDLARVSKPGVYRPVLFAKNRIGDGFLLLRDEQTKRYFIWLNLVPSSSKFAKLTAAESKVGSCRKVSNLVNMRTGEVISFSSKTGCLFPIEFGRDYQDAEFLESGSPLTAMLLRRDKGYFVHIAFEFKKKAISPTTFMGVDRGIYNLASMSVIDKQGTIIDRRNADGRDLRFVQRKIEQRQRKQQRRGKVFKGKQRLHAADEAVHRSANEIVAMAQKHDAQVIMENLAPLASRRGKRKRSNFNRVLNRSQYQKLQSVLKYKLAVAGIPPAKEVHPAYTSQACPICGHISKDNREKIALDDGFKMDVFKCAECTHTDDADLNAARNIALKRMWRDSLSPAFKKKLFNEVPDKKSFPNFLKTHASKRGESACDLRIGTFGRSDLDASYEDGEAQPGSNADEPWSGSNTHVSNNSASKQTLVSLSGKNSHKKKPNKRGPTNV